MYYLLAFKQHGEYKQVLYGVEYLILTFLYHQSSCSVACLKEPVFNRSTFCSLLHMNDSNVVLSNAPCSGFTSAQWSLPSEAL
jgi:hypothetical protein